MDLNFKPAYEIYFTTERFENKTIDSESLTTHKVAFYTLRKQYYYKLFLL